MYRIIVHSKNTKFLGNEANGPQAQLMDEDTHNESSEENRSEVAKLVSPKIHRYFRSVCEGGVKGEGHH